MESAKNNSSYRKIKTIINDNKLESDIEYRLVSFNIDNMKQINNENGLIINYTYNSKNSGFNKDNKNDNKKKKNSAFFWINLICGCN